MGGNFKEKVKIKDELRGQYKQNKHHIIKMIIAIILVPTVTSVLDNFVFGEGIPIYLSMLISTWATYLLLTIYDGVIVRETQRAKSQIIKNTVAILVIEEDVKALQEEVYKEDVAGVRARNYTKAMKRKGESYMGGDVNAKSSKD